MSDARRAQFTNTSRQNAPLTAVAGSTLPSVVEHVHQQVTLGEVDFASRGDSCARRRSVSCVSGPAGSCDWASFRSGELVKQEQ